MGLRSLRDVTVFAYDITRQSTSPHRLTSPKRTYLQRLINMTIVRGVALVTLVYFLLPLSGAPPGVRSDLTWCDQVAGSWQDVR